jgi:predicted RNase H-like nuclease
MGAQRTSAPHRGPLRVIGVDGCRGGWVAVALRDGSFESAVAADGISEILSHYEGTKAVGIDIPIGAERGRFRRVDSTAKEKLGPRSSTLFETPPLEVLACSDFASALTLCRDLTGKGFSKQSHGLRERILEVDAIAKRDRRIIEVHPELSFRAMAGRLLRKKKSWNGACDRKSLLEKAGIRLPADLGGAGETAGVDDVLDAAAAAWTANRFALGMAENLEPVVQDLNGRDITIWY